MTLNRTKKLIKRKAEQVLAAERRYWENRQWLAKRYNDRAALVDSKPIESMKLVSRIFGFRDGCMIARFSPPPGEDFQVLVFDAPIKEWRECVTVPASVRDNEGKHSTGEWPIGKFILETDFQLQWCELTYPDMHARIGFTHVVTCSYDDHPDLEDAIHDLNVTILGASAEKQVNKPSDLIESHVALLEQFKALLDNASNEEELQQFLKENPILLIPNGQAIPKQKLGADFVTDFVLINMLDQGPNYTLVEIEKASHEVFTKDGELRNCVSHAIKQTIDWDVWLEKHQNYLQSKLPGFESPKYEIIIGRSTDFTEDHRATLRAYNRNLSNTRILTYDDVAREFDERIKAMRSHFGVDENNG